MTIRALVFHILLLTCSDAKEFYSASPPAKHKQKRGVSVLVSQQQTALFWVLLSGAVGLYNIGLSCCINSLLQSFLMNRYFTSILRRINVPFGTAERKASVPYQMLLLLESMQRAKGKSVRPFDLIYCLSYHGVRLFVLHDASEVYYKIWNLLKDQIADTDLVKSYFYKAEKIFLSLWFYIVPSLYGSFFLFFLLVLEPQLWSLKPTSDIVGQNWCVSNQEEDTAFPPWISQCLPRLPIQTEYFLLILQRTKISYLPRMLTLHLTRFHSKDGNRTKKVTHSLAFPPELDFSQILTLEQYQPDAKKKNDGLYDLFAVIAHSGPADFGHYCAYIWSLTEHKWYCFNDSSVCEVRKPGSTGDGLTQS
uniref:Ubiquitin specific peptidase 18 n=1 Tax=Naja naja TaxID=35670 RepID=A0A8C7E6W9_NAJNA